MGLFDTVKKIVSGDVAHDAADSGNPIKIGGKAAATQPAAVSSGDRVNAWFTNYGELAVAIGGPSTLAITPAAPTPTGTDVTALNGTALASTDLAVRDTNFHYFIRPTLGRSIGSISLRIQTAFDVACTFDLYGMVTTGASVLQLLPTINISISTTALFSFGNLAPAANADLGYGDDPPAFSYFYVPNLHILPYVGLRIKFGSAPASGQIEYMYWHRSAS